MAPDIEPLDKLDKRGQVASPMTLDQLIMFILAARGARYHLLQRQATISLHGSPVLGVRASVIDSCCGQVVAVSEKQTLAEAITDLAQKLAGIIGVPLPEGGAQ